jgi:hypothetical protein
MLLIYFYDLSGGTIQPSAGFSVTVYDMNNKRIEKLKMQLASTESELRTQLLSVLPNAVESGADYFTNSAFNPHDLLSAHMQPTAENFLHLAEESLSLRDQLHLPKQGTVGDLYFLACYEAADLNNEHRL